MGRTGVQQVKQQRERENEKRVKAGARANEMAGRGSSVPGVCWLHMRLASCLLVPAENDSRACE